MFTLAQLSSKPFVVCQLAVLPKITFNIFNIIRFFFFSLALAFTALTVRAVEPNAYSIPVIKSISAHREFAHAFVTSIIEDSKGFIWFATYGGISRFDGYQIKSYKAGNDERSLSHANVNAMIQDLDGNIWVGTYKGLNRFNPQSQTFQHYFSETDDLNSIDNNFIRSFWLDSHGTLWIGSSQGLNYYDAKEDRFYRVDLPQMLYGSSADELIGDVAKASRFSINAIKQDNKGLLWIAAEKQGLIQYNPQKQQARFVNTPIKQGQLGVINFNSIDIDKNNQLWGATIHGLVRFDLDSQRSEIYQYNQSPTKIAQVKVDAKGDIWISADEKGLCQIKPLSESLLNRWRCFNPTNQPTSAKYVSAIFQDSQMRIWLATRNSGVLFFDPAHPFELINFEKPHQFIQNLTQDTHKNLWVGTGAGVVRLDDAGNKTIFRHEPKSQLGIDSDNIFSVTLDNLVQKEKTQDSSTQAVLNQSLPQQLWIGTNKGIHYYDEAANKIIPVVLQPEKPLVEYGIIGAFRNAWQSDDGAIYFPSSKQNYLVKWQSKQKTFTPIPFASQESASQESKRHYGRKQFSSFVDSQQRLWVSGHEYIGYLNTVEQSVEITEESLNTGRIYVAITQDNLGRLWAIDFHGLHQLNKQGKIIKSYSSSIFNKSMLFTIVTNRLSPELWIGSNQGLWQFNPQTEQVKQYTRDDGLQDNDFNNARLVDDKGYIYVGGVNGISVFHPTQLETFSLSKPETQLTQLRINNIPVSIGTATDSVLKQPIHYQTEIVLNAKQSQLFSLEFSSLDYFSAPTNQYAYQLLGYNDDWIYTDAQNRQASYTSLPAGNYVFQVKAANANGEWSEKPTTLQIRIIAPWWQTYWAYGVYLLGFLLLVGSFVRHRVNLAERRANELEVQVELRTRLIQQQRDELAQKNQQLEDIGQAKNQFFTNISHEFRTPLTLAIGPLQAVIANNNIQDEKDKNYIEVALKNNLHMQSLLGQVLDINRLEAGKMPLNISQVSVLNNLQYCVERFTLEAEKLSLQFKLQGMQQTEHLQHFYFDSEHFEKIMLNLLSNAVKFSPVNGIIEVGLKAGVDELIIWIKDEGRGIAKQDQRAVFERYYQGAGASNSRQPGTGIGLALVKELLQLHQASIQLDSEIGQGCCFTLTFKLGIEHYATGQNAVGEIINSEQSIGTPHDDLLRKSKTAQEPNEEIKDKLKAEVKTAADSATPSPNSPIKPTSDQDIKPTTKQTLLVVDDNAQLRAFIRSVLENSYQIIEAENGQVACELIATAHPDIIVSDVMMPVMDGLKLAQKLKQSTETAHIPLILLTAKTGTDDIVQGLQSGADDYLSKPFSATELVARIAAQIAQKRRQASAMFEQFRQQYPEVFELQVTKPILKASDSNASPQPLHPPVTQGKASEDFASELLKVIHQHLHHSDFDVGKLCEYLHIHQATLNRKVKKQFDCTPVQLLRHTRLKVGLAMLQREQGTISEIAYACGFESLAYFSRSFRQYFKKPPSQYQEIDSKPL
ncbi:two-component regulator propeller domain-containing protein [Aliikangiella maris]|uniref:Two-component regulator propeller domain-containing protein n=2 Tax=Aliikangiella maris TaxID=3162458 RepID=A0ABV3MR00_9GAMM